MAAGRVATGFSLPYVAEYANSSGTISYSNGMKLARGVSVALSVEQSDDNDFYADNIVAESEGGIFSSGEVTLTVDGLKDAAAQLIFGVDAPTSQNTWTRYGKSATPPYVGIGYITRYVSGGTTTYVPTILRRARFAIPTKNAETQNGANVNYQTEELTARLYRDESTDEDWKWEGQEETTEAAAEAKIKTALGIT